MEKKKPGKTYENARLEIVLLGACDVLCTSGPENTSTELGSSGNDPSAWL